MDIPPSDTSWLSVSYWRSINSEEVQLEELEAAAVRVSGSCLLPLGSLGRNFLIYIPVNRMYIFSLGDACVHLIDMRQCASTRDVGTAFDQKIP